MTIPVLSWRAAVLKTTLPANTKFVLVALSTHMNDHGEGCYPSVTTLAKETSLSRQTVITHLKLAREAGWITVERHGFAGQKWARNDYRVSWPEPESEPFEDDEGGQEFVSHENECGTANGPPLEEKGGQAVEPPPDEGGQTVGPKVVKQLDSNSPVNSPILYPTKGKLDTEVIKVGDTREGFGGRDAPQDDYPVLPEFLDRRRVGQ